MPMPTQRSWLLQHERRTRILHGLSAPATPSQLARTTGFSRDMCCYTLLELCGRGLAECINPDAARFRLFALTRKGLRVAGLKAAISWSTRPEFWLAYAEILYPHRFAVVRTLARPMQGAEIKRLACCNDPRLRMSAGNVRDVLGVLLGKGIVRKFHIRKSAYPRYELTELGTDLRAALLAAEVRR